MKISYYAVFQYDIDGICISFPDVPPALTCADNEADGMRYAKEALELALHGMFVDNIPSQSSADQMAVSENQKLFLITVALDIKSGKLFSKNVTELN